MVAGVGVAHAKDDHGRRDRDQYYGNRAYNNNYDQAYRQGVDQGQYDRSRGLRANYRRGGAWHNGDDRAREAYRRGYEEGYSQGTSAYNGPYSNQPYGYNQPYGNNQPYYGRRGYGYANRTGTFGNQPYQQGFADGRSDGLHDQATGHSYRPTHDDNYKHADRGYISSFGSKNAYKQEYRQGYLQGYEQGYRR